MYRQYEKSPGRAAALGPCEELSSLLDAPILSQSTNQARPRSSPPAHRGGRVIGTDALRILVISQERTRTIQTLMRIRAARCPWFVPTDTQKQKKAPGRGSRGFQGVETMKGIQGSRCPRRADTILMHKSDKARIA